MALDLSLDALAERLETSGTALLVTPNARLARTVRQTFDRRQQSAGRAVWTPARVLAWDQWLSSLWTSLVLAGHEDRILLNPAQEHALWREIVQADATTIGLTPPDSLADLSRTAFRLAAAYRGVERIRGGATLDVRTFARWADEFQRRCARGRWVSASLADAELAAHLERGTLRPPEALALCGMDDLTPNRQHLLDLLQAEGCRIEQIRLLATDAATPEAATLENEASEARVAVEWLREQMQQKPDGAFALVVPGLAAEWPTLESVLREGLAPELNDIAADPFAAIWATETGTSLADAPVVSALFGVVRWLRGPLPVEQVTELLLSPYFGTGVSLDARARFDAHVRRKELLLRPELGLSRMLRLAREQELGALTDWLAGLKDLSETLSTMPPRRTYADWMEFLRSAGKRVGWLNEERMGRHLTAGERATAGALDATLDLIATLDFAGQRVTFAEALRAAERQTASAPLPANPAARVEIVDFSAIEGLAGKNGIVFLRSTEKNLPQSAQAHPLLDWGLQRTLAMPGTDATADTARFERALCRLVDRTETSLFTISQEGNSGTHQTSSIIAGIQCKQFIKNDLHDNKKEIELEDILDQAPIPPLPSTAVSGGARLIQLQAACGFLAFAEMRLGGRDLETQEPGFDAVESGNVLHRALEAFWKSVVSQDQLRRMSEAERREAVEKAVNEGVSRRIRLEDPWDVAYIALLKQRMQKVLLRWLDFELERAPFTVLASENKQGLRVGPLELEVRIDRIDSLADDGLVFVDYKTGAGARPSAWEGKRPDQPQLPLYSLLAEPEELRGLAFARIRAGEEMQWAGYAGDEGVLPKKGAKVVDLPEAVAAWRTVLDDLAQQFHEGISCVSPKSYDVNCKRCSQRLLCRLDVAELMAISSEEGDAEEETNDA
jgi:ATP-dependent helicase/nuclease subunit B